MSIGRKRLRDLKRLFFCTVEICSWKRGTCSWAEESRRRYQQQYFDALLRLADCYASLGRLRQAISCCQRLLQVEPHSEAAICHLLTYQEEVGYHAQALETYRRGERALRDHLDVLLSPDICVLRDRIRRGIRAVPDLDTRRIAVLPLQNLVQNPEDEYIADGLTEELIGWIAKVKDFRVLARPSVMRFKDMKTPVSQIARDLNVGTVLEGSVRKVRNRIRVSAQLIDAATEAHVWAEKNYDLDLGDVLETQGEIARRVTEVLKLELLPGEEEALLEAETADSKAHISYLEGATSCRGRLERSCITP